MDYENYQLKTDQPLASMRSFSSDLRSALISVGKSANTHIYDLTEDAIQFFRNKPEHSFFVKAMKAYSVLNEVEKRVCVYDLLEPNNHYRFWYLPFFCKSAHERMVKQVAEKFCRGWPRA